MIKNPYQTYQRQAVTTAKPEELTLMLYQGMVKFIRLSKQSLQNNKLEESQNYNFRVQDILSELMVTLKPGNSISNSLMPIYDYMKNCLIEANIQKKVEILEDVEGHAVELAETWATAIKKIKAGN